MGLKERVSSVKGKALMTSFAAAEAMDITMTYLAINYFGAKEANIFGGAELMGNFDQAKVFILKIAVTAILIGIYALASDHDPKLKTKFGEIKAKWIAENALQMGNIIAWGVVTWDSVNLAPEIAKAVLK